MIALNFRYAAVLCSAVMLAGPGHASDSALAKGSAPAAVFAPVEAAEISFEAQRYVARPLVIFADSPDDLNFQRQLALVQSGLADLAFRDVVVVIDTDPTAMSEWRRHLRPRGFSLVQLDKDFSPVFRKPLPWSVREIARAIDKLESRRQEVAERFPGR